MSGMSDGLTPAMRRLWEGEGDGPRAARQGLSLDRIVAAAVELADADGLAAVSMARVARRLGFTTMSLYRHVEGKEELLRLMADAASGEPPRLDPAAGWRAGMERWTRAMYRALLVHPWYADLPITGPPRLPNGVAWFDRALEALAQTGLDEGEKLGVVLLANGTAFWHARLTIEFGGAARARGSSVEEETAAYGTAIDGLISGERFPSLRRALDSGVFSGEEEDADADFEFGLRMTLDGVERLVERRRAGR
jgi:AcrR family transcriptional regulator